jgi:hypothetical protein
MGFAYLAIIRCVFHINAAKRKKSRFIILILLGKKIVAVASLNQPVPVPLRIAGLAKKLNGVKSYSREEVELLKCCA